MKTLLQVQDLSIAFGGNQVLCGVSFELYENEVLGVIGPNGAGKTVLLNILSGILKPTGGKVLFGEENLLRKRIDELVTRGIGRTFQMPRPFKNMTVFENVIFGGCYGCHMTETQAKRHAIDVLGSIGLLQKSATFAGELGLLDRKRLEIGIALASKPKILLLDEVAGGLTESEVAIILQLVRKIKQAGTSVIWIEHVIQTMLEGTDRVMLLAEGKNLLCGSPSEVMASDEVDRCYLGMCAS